MTIYEEEIESGQRRRASIDRKFINNYSIFNTEGTIIEDGVEISEITSSISIPLKIIFYEEKNYNLKAKLSYSVHKQYDIIYKCDDIYDLDITVQPPFQFEMKWLKDIEVNSQAAMNVKIWNICMQPIYLNKISLITETGWHCDQVKFFQELEINEGNILSEDFIVNNTLDSPCALLGSLLVTWFRKDGVINDCRIPLTPVLSRYFPFQLIVDVGPEYHIGEVFEMTVKTINKTKILLEAKLILEESSYFLIGGVENMKFDLKEEGEKSFKFSLVCFETGIVDLPRVHIKLLEVQRVWQRKILILP